MEGKGIVKPYCSFLKYTDDPTASLRKTSTSEKQLGAVRKQSPGSTTATEGDDLIEGKGIVFCSIFL
jgi:hypothetical protein